MSLGTTAQRPLDNMKNASWCMLRMLPIIPYRTYLTLALVCMCCRLGVSTKVINSVLQDGVILGDGCTVQNSILCAGVQVKDKALLKDCQVCS